MLRSIILRSLLLLTTAICTPAFADHHNDPREQALSDALDLWREGRFEQLYNSLSRRGGTGREQFVQFMKDARYRPACCHLKLNDFKLIAEHTTTSKVFARVGMEGGFGSDTSQSREFTLDHEEGGWKPRLSEIKSLAGGKKSKKRR